MSSTTINVVRTALAGSLQSSQFMGLPQKKLPYSTLNQKLGIQADAEIPSDKLPVCRYVGIGNGGHDFVISANNRRKYVGLHHEPQHTALYNQLPFVLRTLDNDLSLAERAKYRLRRVEEHDGVLYLAYYLRVLDFTDVSTELELRHVENGITTSTPYVPTIENMNPVPPSLTAGSIVTTSGDYIASSTKVPFVMTVADIQEFQRAVEIIEGDAGFSLISEMVTVAALDATVSTVINGSPQQYTEAIGAQIMSFITTGFITEYHTDGIKMTIDVGNVEPLMKVTAD